MIFIAILTFFIKRSDRIQEEGIEDFWTRERDAKLTRAVDISTLPYLNVPIEKFSFGTVESSDAKKLEEEITSISKKPLINLAGKTNTELMETYGSPNLDAMKEIGEDFDRLTIALAAYGEVLFDSGHITEAITVLEYGVFIKSDVSKTYTVLCDCFDYLNQKRRIENLRSLVAPMNMIMTPVILAHIDGILEKYSGEEDSEKENYEI